MPRTNWRPSPRSGRPPHWWARPQRSPGTDRNRAADAGGRRRPCRRPRRSRGACGGEAGGQSRRRAIHAILGRAGSPLPVEVSTSAVPATPLAVIVPAFDAVRVVRTRDNCRCRDIGCGDGAAIGEFADAITDAHVEHDAVGAGAVDHALVGEIGALPSSASCRRGSHGRDIVLRGLVPLLEKLNAWLTTKSTSSAPPAA